jgi:hypothetical protein
VATTAPLAGMSTRWFFRSCTRALRDASAYLSLMWQSDLGGKLLLERDSLVNDIDALGELAEELRASSTRTATAPPSL